MSVKSLLPLLSLGLFMFCGCGNPSPANQDIPKDSLVGKVEILDSSALDLLNRDAVVEVIGRNYKWSEGPVWVPSGQMLLFSDVLANTIFSWNGKDTPVAWLTPSGYTDTAARAGENGSNGLTLDRNGKLLLCQSGNRQVVRLNSPLDSPAPAFTVLASRYEGTRFNSPNDLVTDRNNNIYFTDPIYGLPKRDEDPTRELKFEGVYRISNNGKLNLLIDSIKHPNGIALSPDEKILYVGSSDAQTKWYAYTLDSNGMISGGGIFIDGMPLKEKASFKSGADGFRVDSRGNIFSSGPDGINIFSPQGKLLALIKVFNRPTSNCAFNETRDVLFITADDLLLRVKLK